MNENYYAAPTKEEAPKEVAAPEAEMEGEIEEDDDIVMLEDDTDYQKIMEEQKAKNGGKTKNDFELLSVIGQGSYGKVYLVRDKKKPD